MAATEETEQLEKDFLSGRNPLAYIPLCQSLRKQRLYARALEICQKGLAQDPNSVAGRTLYARLLSDLGHYEDALREVTKAEAGAPDAMGLLVEKARCLIRLRRFDEAEAALRALEAKNPLDPQVQLMRTQLRQIQAGTSSSAVMSSRDAVPRLVRLTSREVVDHIIREMKGVVSIKSCAAIPIAAGEPALEGNALPAEAAFAFYREATVACKELDCGSMRVGFIESAGQQLIVLVRQAYIVSFAFEPSANFGKIYHRLLMVVGSVLPEEPRGRKAKAEEGTG